MFDLVIFDCDGVLVDSEPISNVVLMELLVEVGLPMDYDETMRTFVGRSDAACLAMIEDRLGRPLPKGLPERWERLLHERLREVMPVDGIVDALDRIPAPTCVASSSSHARMRVTLGAAGLLPRFEGRLFSATEVAHGKPAPDLFLHAAHEMGIPPWRCAVVEDTPVGASGGSAAGMTVFGYAGGAHSDPDELAAAGARVFEKMDLLPELITKGSPYDRR